MRRLAAILLLAALAGGTLLVGRDERPQPIWHAGAEGGLTAWRHLERAAPDRLRTDDGLAGEGERSYRFEVRDGDLVFGGERTEAAGIALSDGDEEPEELLLGQGDTVHIGWRQRFSRTFPSPRGEWCVFLQLKEVPNRGSPLISMACGDGTQSLELGEEHRYRALWRRSLVRGRWQSFVLGVRLSRGGDGTLALWHDGRRVASMRGQTLRDGVRVRLKVGIYRSPAIAGPAVAHVDDVRVAREYEGAVPG